MQYSVSNQNYENIELIVIDGNWLRCNKSLCENNNEIDIWLSEDNGLWDAWNKGFKLARGFVGVVTHLIFYMKTL